MNTVNNNNSELEILDINTIMSVLPHRYPFLLIDKVIIEEAGVRAKGIKAVTANEPQFTGHFPSMPIFPGVLIAEAMAQTGIMLSWAAGRRKIGNVYLRSIEKAKFSRMVMPGCLLEMQVTQDSFRKGIYSYSGNAFVDGLSVAKCIFSAIEQPKTE